MFGGPAEGVWGGLSAQTDTQTHRHTQSHNTHAHATLARGLAKNGWPKMDWPKLEWPKSAITLPAVQQHTAGFIDQLRCLTLVHSARDFLGLPRLRKVSTSELLSVRLKSSSRVQTHSNTTERPLFFVPRLDDARCNDSRSCSFRSILKGALAASALEIPTGCNHPRSVAPASSSTQEQRLLFVHSTGAAWAPSPSTLLQRLLRAMVLQLPQSMLRWRLPSCTSALRQRGVTQRQRIC